MKPDGEVKPRLGVTCIICSTPIPDAKGRRIYCDACRKEIANRNRRNHRMLNQNEKNYKDVVAEMKSEKETGSHMSISKVVKAAKEEGISYGKYVAKYGV